VTQGEGREMGCLMMQDDKKQCGIIYSVSKKEH
jgi:hypothetical protein